MVFESVGEKIGKGIADVVMFCDMATRSPWIDW